MENQEAKPEENQRQEFDLEQALNNEGFLKFLAQSPDSESLLEGEEHEAEIAKRFEAFQIKGEAALELKNIYAEKIYQDCGISLSEKDTASVEAYIEKEAVEHPERIRGLLEEARRFRELPDQITEARNELQGIIREEREEFSDKDNLRQIWDNLVTAEETQGVFNKKNLPILGRFFRSPEESEARRKVVEEYGMELRDVSDELDRLEERFDALEELVKLKKLLNEDYTHARELFLKGVEPAEDVAKKARKKAQARLRDLADPTKSLGGLEEAQDYFEQLAGKEGEIDVDYLRGINREDFQKELDKTLEARIAQDIRDAVEKVSLGGTPLAQLEQALGEYTEKQKLGSKGSAEVIEFLRTTLGDIAEETQEKEKKILLKYLLIRMRK